MVLQFVRLLYGTTCVGGTTNVGSPLVNQATLLSYDNAKLGAIKRHNSHTHLDGSDDSDFIDLLNRDPDLEYELAIAKMNSSRGKRPFNRFWDWLWSKSKTIENKNSEYLEWVEQNQQLQEETHKEVQVEQVELSTITDTDIEYHINTTEFADWDDLDIVKELEFEHQQNGNYSAYLPWLRSVSEISNVKVVMTSILIISSLYTAKKGVKSVKNQLYRGFINIEKFYKSVETFYYDIEDQNRCVQAALDFFDSVTKEIEKKLAKLMDYQKRYTNFYKQFPDINKDSSFENGYKKSDSYDFIFKYVDDKLIFSESDVSFYQIEPLSTHEIIMLKAFLAECKDARNKILRIYTTKLPHNMYDVLQFITDTCTELCKRTKNFHAKFKSEITPPKEALSYHSIIADIASFIVQESLLKIPENEDQDLYMILNGFGSILVSNATKYIKNQAPIKVRKLTTLITTLKRHLFEKTNESPLINAKNNKNEPKVQSHDESDDSNMKSNDESDDSNIQMYDERQSSNVQTTDGSRQMNMQNIDNSENYNLLRNNGSKYGKSFNNRISDNEEGRFKSPDDLENHGTESSHTKGRIQRAESLHDDRNRLHKGDGTNDGTLHNARIVNKEEEGEHDDANDSDDEENAVNDEKKRKNIENTDANLKHSNNEDLKLVDIKGKQHDEMVNPTKEPKTNDVKSTGSSSEPKSALINPINSNPIISEIKATEPLAHNQNLTSSINPNTKTGRSQNKGLSSPDNSAINSQIPVSADQNLEIPANESDLQNPLIPSIQKPATLISTTGGIQMYDSSKHNLSASKIKTSNDKKNQDGGSEPSIAKNVSLPSLENGSDKDGREITKTSQTKEPKNSLKGILPWVLGGLCIICIIGTALATLFAMRKLKD